MQNALDRCSADGAAIKYVCHSFRTTGTEQGTKATLELGAERPQNRERKARFVLFILSPDCSRSL